MEGARRAGPADLPALTHLAEVALAELRPHRGGALWARHQGRPAPVEPTLAAQLDAGDATIVVVGTIDDIVIGYGVASLERLHDGAPLAVVSDLYVLPEGRGVGVGEAMMEELVAWARGHGAVGIDALALPGDRDTKNFFETFGLTARAIVVHRALDPEEPA